MLVPPTTEARGRLRGVAIVVKAVYGERCEITTAGIAAKGRVPPKEIADTVCVRCTHRWLQFGSERSAGWRTRTSPAQCRTFVNRPHSRPGTTPRQTYFRGVLIHEVIPKQYQADREVHYVPPAALLLPAALFSWMPFLILENSCTCASAMLRLLGFPPKYSVREVCTCISFSFFSRSLVCSRRSW